MHKQQACLQEDLTVKSAVRENREYERYSCVLDVSCLESEEVDYAPARPACINNISKGGLCLIAYEKFEPGTELTIGLTSTTENFLPPLKVRVVHATEQSNGTWTIGCAFTRKLSEAELQGLL